MKNNTLKSSSAPLPGLVVENSRHFPRKAALSHKDLGIWLFQENCLEFMDAMTDKYPDGFFDMIFADPPYFLSNGGITCHAGKMVKVDKGNWDKSKGVEHDHAFNLAWMQRCQRVLKPNGTIWVSGTHHIIHSVGYAMQQLGMKILNDIVWQKVAPPPNLSCRYFTHATETIIWAAREKQSRHTFNYAEMKKINGGRQMKSVWTFPAANREEKKHGRHPTQKPVDLLTRIIAASTRENDFIFDPFAGSSSTGVAAVRLNRHFVGCEIEEEFVQLSKKRILAAVELRQG